MGIKIYWISSDYKFVKTVAFCELLRFEQMEYTANYQCVSLLEKGISKVAVIIYTYMYIGLYIPFVIEIFHVRKAIPW